MKKIMKIYTDGACSGNPGKGAWAFVVLDSKEHTEVSFEKSGYNAMTTNNRMELRAVIEALIYVQAQGETEVIVYTDSQYVKNGISTWIFNWKKNGWLNAQKKTVKNQDLWKELDAQVSMLSVSWQWVRGHSGNKWNERCDTLAVTEIKKH